MAIIRKIAAVSYLNTVPFIYGIQSRAAELNAELITATPAQCAELFAEGEVDVALVPISSLETLTDYNIISPYCIGSEGAVRSVVILSDEAIEQVKRIFVDGESRTSVQLAGYLAKNLWKIDPEWCSMDSTEALLSPEDGDAFLLIGDKVFEHEGEFEYTYDLSSAWYSATSLPFAFAVWIAREGVDEEFISTFDEALTFGIEHLYEAIMELRGSTFLVESYQYLSENIDFLLDGAKREAMNKFLSSKVRVEPKSIPT